jgi:transcriptional antiterminator
MKLGCQYHFLAGYSLLKRQGELQLVTIEGPFTVQRILSNNAVIANTVIGQDVILLGKGMGFGRKAGDLLKSPKYEKIYVVPEGVAEQQALSLIEQVEPAVIQVAEDIIELAKTQLGQALHPRVYVALTDHINFTLIRLSQSMEIKNPFISEIEVMYPDEFYVATQGAKLISERLSITIPREEIGFIALHLHAARHNRSVGESLKHSQVISKVIQHIEIQIGPLQENSGLNYTRLLTHLQSSIHRVITNTAIENPFMEHLKKDFARSYELARQVGDIIEMELQVKVPDAEIGYLTIHLERIRGKHH